MAVAWFLAPYKRRDLTVQGVVIRRGRYCAIDDFRDAIVADNGAYAYGEVLGGYGIAKVRASSATLTSIAADPNIRRIPVARLDDPLSTLTPAQKTTLGNWIEALGYPRTEWQADLGTDLGTHTLREVLRLVRKRRLRPRFDEESDTFLLDGEASPTRPLADIDNAVADA